ncbi:Uncharacterised protein [Vibrio cholerae]|nr:Uncharacterised protein [Vibrio cholerae]
MIKPIPIASRAVIANLFIVFSLSLIELEYIPISDRVSIEKKRGQYGAIR